MADLVEDEEEMKVRGRPRLTDSDRTRRRLESRKKYDCRRVYLGEAHGAWVLRRDAGGQGEPWSDAKLATHLLALERHGKISEDDPTLEHHDRRRRPRVNNLQSLVTWFQDHMCQCPHEPGLSALDTNHALYVTAVWQCQAGHRFFQDLQCPFKKLNHLGSDEEDSDSSSTSPLEEALLVPCSPSEQTADTLYSTPVKSEIRCTEEESETVVCVPVGPETEELFQGVTQETLGQVVATSCPSQVIIIAGPGYEALAAEGIQLRVTEGSIGEDGACTTLEAVTAYTRTEVMDQELEQHIAVAVREDNTLYCLQRVGTEGEGECDGDDVQGQAEPASTLVHEDRTNTAHNKKTEKRKRKRCRALDGDRALKKFHCPYGGCSQVYTALNSFQNHVNLVHRKGRTKVCPEPGCGKSFYLSNHLHRHMIIHTDVREFICETCAKSFKRKSHLEVHRRTHTGETPLQCEVCGFQCRQRASLNWHMKKHQEELQYSFSCEHCGKLFEKQESVKFHKLKSHPDVMTA